MSKPRYCVFQAACEGTAIPTELCRTEVFSQLMSGKSDTRASTVWRKESCPLPWLITGKPLCPTSGKYSPAHSTRVKNHPPERCDQQQSKAGSHREARATAPFLLHSLPAPGSSRSREVLTPERQSWAAPLLLGRCPNFHEVLPAL